METGKPRYWRIMLKMSGEALMGDKSFGIDPTVLKEVADEVHIIHQTGLEMAIVIGGGNIFRGLDSSEYGMGRVPADHMGMLATIINAIALAEALKNIGSETRIMSAIDMNKIAEPYIRGRAITHLKKNRIVLLGGGTGNPYMTTDTAASLRAVEIEAEALLMAKNGVDGVYDADPRQNANAKRFDKLTYQVDVR